MGTPQEELFVQISSQFDPKGFNDASANLELVSQKLQQFSSFFVKNTVMAWASLEKEMITVAKTVGLTSDEMNDMANVFLNLSNKTGQSTEELAKIAGIAGQLGVKKNDILDFTETVAKMAIALDMTAEQAADAGAMIANSFRLETTGKTMMKIGDIINSLADTTAASSQSIAEFLKAFGNTATGFKLTVEEAAGLGTVLISAGKDASSASTQLTSAFSSMIDFKKGGAGIADAAELMGISIEKMKKSFDANFLGTFKSIVIKLGEIPSATDRANKAFDIFGAVGAKSVLNFVGNIDSLNQAIDTAQKKASPMGAEFDRVMAGLGRQMDRTWQIIKNIGTLIGIDLAPNLTAVLGHLNNFVEGIYNLAAAHPILRAQFSALGAMVATLGGMFTLYAGVKGIGAFMAALQGLGGASAAATGAAAAGTTVAAGGATGAIGGAVVGMGGLIMVMKSIAGVGGAMFVGWKIGEFIGELKGVQNIFDSIFETLGLFDYEVAQLGERAKGRTPSPKKPGQGATTGTDLSGKIELSFKKTGDDFIDYILDNLVARARTRSTCDCGSCKG